MHAQAALRPGYGPATVSISTSAWPRRWRRAVAAPVLLAALLGLFAGARAAQASEVTYLDHPAQIKRKGAVEWVRLNMGDKVAEGDAIRTGAGGRVEVLIEPKRVFRIGQATEIELPSFTQKGGMKTQVNVLLGRMWANIGTPLKEVAGEQFRVATKTATIGVKGTRFGVDYDKKENSSQVSVLDGVVAAVPPEQVAGVKEIEGPREIAPPQEVSQAAWQVLVGRDQKVIIRPGEVPKVVPLTDEDKADEWIAFNNQRDLAQQRQ
jgi:ferric-dicitrate binding protein FerR (iron transport regulator)